MFKVLTIATVGLVTFTQAIQNTHQATLAQTEDQADKITWKGFLKAIDMSKVHQRRVAEVDADAESEAETEDQADKITWKGFLKAINLSNTHQRRIAEVDADAEADIGEESEAQSYGPGNKIPLEESN